jgi:hypothetical protein
MNKIFSASLFLLILTFFLHAENNDTNRSTSGTEHNKSVKQMKSDSNKTTSSSDLTKKQVQEQMEREKKYAREQSFAQGDDYDLKAVEVNKDSLDSIPLIEPDYDFDITDVYRDDL